MSNRHIMVEDVCKQCGKVYSLRRTKFLHGKAAYCSKECFYNAKREAAARIPRGYENGVRYPDGHGGYLVRWYDNFGNPRTTQYPRWYWTMFVGDVPAGYVIIQKDRNLGNIDPSNFELISKKEFNALIGKKRIGSHISEEHKLAVSKANKGRILTKEHRNKIIGNISNSWGKKGNESQFWVGGKSKEKYPPEFSVELHKEIYQRDRFSCRICSVTLSEYGLGCVHHVDANKDNNLSDNLILLCRSCHGKIHTKSNKTNDPVILAFRSRLYT